MRQGGGRRKGWREGIADEEVSLCSRRFRSDGGERIGLRSHVGCTAVLKARDPLEVEAVGLLQERREEEDDGRWAERKKGVVALLFILFSLRLSEKREATFYRWLIRRSFSAARPAKRRGREGGLGATRENQGYSSSACRLGQQIHERIMRKHKDVRKRGRYEDRSKRKNGLEGGGGKYERRNYDASIRPPVLFSLRVPGILSTRVRLTHKQNPPRTPGHLYR